jgi:hypothetical protein
MVIISAFSWDDDNVLHIERHQFSPEEVEEFFTGDCKVRRTRQKLYIALAKRSTDDWHSLCFAVCQAV